MGTAAAAAKSLQSCLTLCDPIDSNPLGSSVPGILQARILEWVAISFSNAWKWKVKRKSLSRARLLVTPWTAAYEAPPSMGFSRQEYWRKWAQSLVNNKYKIHASFPPFPFFSSFCMYWVIGEQRKLARLNMRWWITMKKFVSASESHYSMLLIQRGT